MAAVAAVAAVAHAAGGIAGGGLQHQVSQALEAELERQQHGDEDMDDWEGLCVVHLLMQQPASVAYVSPSIGNSRHFV